MATFERATVTPLGEILLDGGKRYFIDLQVDDYRDLVGDLSDLIEPTPGDEVLISGRGQVMVSLSPPNETLIPNELAQQTGFFFELPEGQTLHGAQVKLYGDTFLEAMGLLDWLAANHPEVLEGSIEVAETVQETGAAIAETAGKTGRIALYVAGAVGAAYLLYLVTRRK